MLNNFFYTLPEPLSQDDIERLGNRNELFERAKSELESKTLNMMLYLGELYPIIPERINRNHHDFQPQKRETRPTMILKTYKSTIDNILNNHQFQVELGPLSPVVHSGIREWYLELKELHKRVVKRHKESISRSRDIIGMILNYLRMFP